MGYTYVVELMFRVFLVILVSLCVTLMPSYAAIRCGDGCGTPIKTCCDNHKDSQHQQQDDSKPDHGGQTCVAPCCGYVAHVATSLSPGVGTQLLADVVPTISTQHVSPAHDTIFHPPRV